VAKTRQRCVEEGPEAALKDRPRPGKMAKLTDKQVDTISPNQSQAENHPICG
jgi:hypothetical protein